MIYDQIKITIIVVIIIVVIFTEFNHLSGKNSR